MEQRINVVTLGVADVLRARAFYEALGWTLGFTDGDIVHVPGWRQHRVTVGRETLSADSGVADSGGWGGVTLGHVVRSETEVDQIFAQAQAAGCSVTRPPRPTGFGYSGIFADPDGHTWEIAYIEAVSVQDDGTVRLPS